MISNFRVFIICFLIFVPVSSLLYGQNSKERPVQFIGFQIIDDKNKVIIPFESYNNLIVIPVVLNGTIPLKFILDTGVRTAILVDRKISDFLNLSYSRTITLVGAAGGKGVAAHVAPNVSLSLPGIRGAGQALLVMDEDYLRLGETLGIDVHGIIGYELFSRFIIEINYINNTVTFHEPSSFKKKRRYSEVSIKVEDTKPYFSPYLRVRDKAISKSKLLVDTGASHSILLHLESHKDIILPQQTITTSLGRGLGGDIQGDIGRVKEICFNGFKLNNVITSFPEEDTYHEIISSTERHGSIGGGLINRFDVIFDYFNEKMYVRKNSDFKRKSNYNMSGIELKAEGPEYKKLLVAEVISGSPAELNDIRVGDEIIKTNGMTGENLTINFLNNIFKSRPNKKINMRILRKGETIKKSFKLKRII